jgi:hypothetical protein
MSAERGRSGRCARDAHRNAANAVDDLSEMHTNYDILSSQLLVEQARRPCALGTYAQSHETTADAAV